MEKSLGEIWTGPFLSRVREDMLAKRLSDHCYKCCPSDVTQRRRLRERLMKSVESVAA